MASLAIENGVDIATVSERFGNSDTGVTTRIYWHGSPQSDRAAASQLDAILPNSNWRGHSWITASIHPASSTKAGSLPAIRSRLRQEADEAHS